MMRNLPYVIVEIPGLSKGVVICNEVAEITFVSARRMGPQFYSTRTKDELRATSGISTVIYRRTEQWLEDISALLFTDRELITIDVRSQEAIRNAIISDAQLTPERWVSMSTRDKRPFKVHGSDMGMCALATRFGVTGNPLWRKSISDRAQLPSHGGSLSHPLDGTPGRCRFVFRDGVGHASSPHLSTSPARYHELYRSGVVEMLPID